MVTYGEVMNFAGPMKTHVEKPTIKPAMMRYRGMFCVCVYDCVCDCVVVCDCVLIKHKEEPYVYIRSVKVL